ncbi:hypothetical protein MIDIC_50017 [Alphaproteobacteria bacterium]
MVVNSLESICSGASATILVAYISSLCNDKFVATQYATMASLASIGCSLFSSTTGQLALSVGWVNFFVFSALLSLPALICLHYIDRKAASSFIDNAKTSLI